MRQKSNGMTLIELLVYLGLFTMLIAINIHWIVQWWYTATLYEKRRVSAINLAAAHDLLFHDIEHAPSIKKAWKVREKSAIVWCQTPTHDIGWLYENNTLFRIEGRYNEHKRSWDAKTKNIVVPRLKDVIFYCHGSATVEWVDVTFADSYHTIALRSIPLSKVIIWNKSVLGLQPS